MNGHASPLLLEPCTAASSIAADSRHADGCVASDARPCILCENRCVDRPAEERKKNKRKELGSGRRGRRGSRTYHVHHDESGLHGGSWPPPRSLEAAPENTTLRFNRRSVKNREGMPLCG